jgi:hypothetical protein
MKASKFTLSSVAVLLLSVSGWAGDKMKANIQIEQTVQVGSVRLAPGVYKMTWTESGSNAEVTLLRGNKVIVTVPAQTTRQRSGFDTPAVVVNGPSSTLTEVELPTETFSFSGENVSSKPGN